MRRVVGATPCGRPVGRGTGYVGPPMTWRANLRYVVAPDGGRPHGVAPTTRARLPDRWLDGAASAPGPAGVGVEVPGGGDQDADEVGDGVVDAGGDEGVQ